MDEGYATLADLLEVLASPTRLEILRALRTPKIASEIRVSPSLSRGEENPDRPLTRQAVSRHLDKLEEAGLVRRTASDDPTAGDAYVLAHDRLFAVVDEIRRLQKLTPILSEPASPGETIERPAEEADLPDPPRLLVAYGRDDGVGFGLDGDGPWTLGRAPGTDVRLDYDPYLSGEHCRLEKRGSGFVVRDLESSNGTWVNWERLDAGDDGVLTSGDVLTVGRSVLVLQA